MKTKTVPIRRIFRVINGGTPTADEKNWGGDVQWATPVDLATTNGGYIEFTSRRLTALGLRTGSTSIQANSLILSTRAPIGYVSQNLVPMAFNQDCKGLLPRLDIDVRFFRYALSAMTVELQTRGQGATFVELSSDALAATRLPLPSIKTQTEIADYLETETSAIDKLVSKKNSLLSLMDERIDAQIRSSIGSSRIAGGPDHIVPLRRLLEKLDRPPVDESQIVTAYRVGVVTRRSARRLDGYTESWTEGSRVQGVSTNDIVLHGLDGFAGAIGTSDSDGVCSPVYHVCRTRNNGEPLFYGRLLRLLAVEGYLGLFASSTRERAVDFRNWDLFGSIPVPVVDVVQQRGIGQEIVRVQELREIVDRSVAIARERRQALITAAIRGELAVPDAAA